MQERMHQAETLPGHALFHLVVLLHAKVTGARMQAPGWQAEASQQIGRPSKVAGSC